MSEILYTSVGSEAMFELEEKRSVFIGYIKPVSTDEEARAYIQQIKAKHHDARHNCSAYLLRDGCMRYSDDGEPQGTAGIPILEVINKSGLVDIVVVVTRYFGGILLGAGGLVRAYSAAAAGAIGSADRAEYQKCTLFEINVEYPLYDKLTRHLSNYGARVIDTVYGESITVDGVIPSDEFALFNASITESFSGKLSVDLIDETINRI